MLTAWRNYSSSSGGVDNSRRIIRDAILYVVTSSLSNSDTLWFSSWLDDGALTLL